MYHSRDLFTNDPLSQENLCFDVERGTVPIRYINEYHSSKKITCAFCKRNDNHLHGYTVELADGNLALCGKDCAVHFFGELIARKLENELKRAQEQERRKNIADRYFSLANSVDWAILNEIQSAEQLLIETGKLVNKLFSGSKLILSHKELQKDTASQISKALYRETAPTESNSGQTPHRTKVGTIHGIRAIQSENFVSPASTQIGNLLKLIKATNVHTTSDVNAINALGLQLQEARNKFDFFIDACRAFYHPQNLQRISEHSTQLNIFGVEISSQQNEKGHPVLVYSRSEQGFADDICKSGQIELPMISKDYLKDRLHAQIAFKP